MAWMRRAKPFKKSVKKIGDAAAFSRKLNGLPGKWSAKDAGCPYDGARVQEQAEVKGGGNPACRGRLDPVHRPGPDAWQARITPRHRPVTANKRTDEMGETETLDPRASDDDQARYHRRLLKGAIGVVMIVGVIGIAVLAYTEHDRDFRLLRDRLAVAADTRVEAVRTWMSREQTDAHLGPRRALLLISALTGTSRDWASERTLLIRAQDPWIRVLSASDEGLIVPNPGAEADRPGALEAAALIHPGTIHDGLDHTGRRVIAVSRPIPDSSWVLVHAVDRAEALADSTLRWRCLIGALSGYLLCVGGVVMATWMVGSSERSRRATETHRRAAERYRTLSTFMDGVLNAQANPVFVIEDKDRIAFVNRSAADLLGQKRNDMVGHALVGVLGQDKGSVLETIVSVVQDTGANRTDTLVFNDEDEAEQVWRTHVRVLEPVPGEPRRVLATVEDLSGLIRERRRRERNTERLIETLVGLVDERDPDSAHQSRHVALVARAVAERMDLDPVLVETAYQAARLVNIGKIRVPKALLTKTGPLTKEEMTQVHAAMDSGLDILRDIEFDGPVLETLRQINEWVDGSGRPAGLSGAEILPTAQVIALANSFVALASPRAFRPELSLEDLERALEAEAGRRFDPGVVEALRMALNDPDAGALRAVLGQQNGGG